MNLCSMKKKQLSFTLSKKLKEQLLIQYQHFTLFSPQRTITLETEKKQEQSPRVSIENRI